MTVQPRPLTAVLSIISLVNVVFIFSLKLSPAVSAFVSPPRSTTSAGTGAVLNSNSHYIAFLVPRGQRQRLKHPCYSSSEWTRRLSASENEEDDEDDDDDMYDDERGPLANGVDSVSWLPSVIGQKGDNMPITSKKEVSNPSSSVVCYKLKLQFFLWMSMSTKTMTLVPVIFLF